MGMWHGCSFLLFVGVFQVCEAGYFLERLSQRKKASAIQAFGPLIWRDLCPGEGAFDGSD